MYLNEQRIVYIADRKTQGRRHPLRHLLMLAFHPHCSWVLVLTSFLVLLKGIGIGGIPCIAPSGQMNWESVWLDLYLTLRALDHDEGMITDSCALSTILQWLQVDTLFGFIDLREYYLIDDNPIISNTLLKLKSSCRQLSPPPMHHLETRNTQLRSYWTLLQTATLKKRRSK